MTTARTSVTLRLMTEHDLPMLHDWLNRPHIVEWWGGEEARPSFSEVQEHYLPRVLAQESVTMAVTVVVPAGRTARTGFPGVSSTVSPSRSHSTVAAPSPPE